MSTMFSGEHDENEPCDGCGKRPSVSMGHGSYKCEECFEAMFCPKCRYTLTRDHVCPSLEEHAQRQRVNGYFLRDMDGTESYSDACLRLDEEVSTLKTQLATATEAAEAARDKALYDAIDAIRKIDRKMRREDYLCDAAKCIEAVQALRAAKEGR